MFRSLLLILLFILITGCAIKKEGVSIGYIKNHYASIDKNKCIESGCPSEVIVIGNVSAYRSIGKDRTREYKKYNIASKKFLGSSDQTLTYEIFKEKVRGWTKVQTYAIPLVGANYESTLVFHDETIKVSYPSDVSVFLVQAVGDLVLARSNVDGVYVLEKVLCTKGEGYDSCKKKYNRGIYSALTGQQLDKKFLRKRDGNEIDLSTYQVKNH